MLRWTLAPYTSAVLPHLPDLLKQITGGARESTAKSAGFDNPTQQIADFINLPLEICKKSAMIICERS
jgi:hypothetical protein